jgi:glycosyltransferase involved in cell wall biosynthesis
VNKLPLRNFQVIPLCADPAPSAPDPRFALDGEFRILFVARLAVGDKYKGLDTLIAAVQRIREQGVPATLHVIGDGDDRPRLEALSSAPGLREHVRFHGRVSDARLQSAYASAHVFAMPSAKEGFGIVFLEAMRRAVPCIGGSHGGTPEVFRDSEEGTLVSYGDVDALAQKLAWFASDEGTRRRLGEAGRMRFERDYTFASFSARWQRLLGTPARS